MKADKVDLNAPFAKKPSALRNTSAMILKTRLAQRLMFGRNNYRGDKKVKHKIIGGIGFADRLRDIHFGALTDDPYADLWLLRIEAALNEAVAVINSLRAQADEILTRRPDFDHSVARPQTPIEVDLNFASPLAFRGAYLISDIDNLTCELLTARHVGLISVRGSDELMSDAATACRRAFLAADGYHFTGVSRADIAYKTAKAEKARKLWGQPPNDVLRGKRRAKHAPPLREDSWARRQEDEPMSPSAAAAK